MIEVMRWTKTAYLEVVAEAAAPSPYWAISDDVAVEKTTS
jgi:hypothetical protein